MSKSSKKLREMTQLAILSAVAAVVAFLPIRTLGLEITLSMVPVAVAAALMGKKGGLVLGTVFGVVSFIQCLGYSPFGAVLFSINPLYTFMVCVPTRMVAGFIAGLLSDILKRPNKTRFAALSACVTAPVLNTVFFMSTLVLCFYSTDYIQGFVSALGAANPFTFVLLFVGINGLVEIVAGIVIAFPVTFAVSSALKRMN